MVDDPLSLHGWRVGCLADELVAIDEQSPHDPDHLIVSSGSAAGGASVAGDDAPLGG